MPKNKMEDLRNHLFETIERLKDGDMEIETAKAIVDVGKVLVDSAKVEVDFQKHVGGIGSDFIEMSRKEQRQIN
jgi:hypothetical protein